MPPDAPGATESAAAPELESGATGDAGGSPNSSEDDQERPRFVPSKPISESAVRDFCLWLGGGKLALDINDVIERWIDEYHAAPTDTDFYYIRQTVDYWNKKLPAAATIDAARRANDGQPRFKLMTTTEWDALDYPINRKRVEGLLPTFGVALIAAAEKTGKSLLAMQGTLAIASGTPFLGRATVQCPALYIEEEGPPGELRDRMRKQRAGLELTEIPDAYWLIRESFRLDSEDDLALLSAQVEKHGIKVIFLGPLAQIAGMTSENDAAEMTKVTRTLTQLANEHQALFVLLHHRRKDGEDGVPTKVSEFFQTVRGSNALIAAVDTAIGLAREPDSPDGRLFVMQRDGQSFASYYQLDFQTLLAGETVKPDNRAAKPDDLLKALSEAPGRTCQALATRFGTTKDTMQRRLNELMEHGKVYTQGKLKQAPLYFVQAEYEVKYDLHQNDFDAIFTAAAAEIVQ